jgi:TonB family protein
MAIPSQFVSIGSQEDVQPSASATGGAQVIPFHEAEKRARMAEPSNRAAGIDSPIARSAASVSPSAIDSRAELKWNSQATPSPTPFGSLLESGGTRTAQQTPVPRRNWLLIGAAAAVVFAGVGAWAFYFQGRPSSNASARPAPASPVQAVQPNLGQNPVSELVQQAPVVPSPAVQAPAVQAPAVTQSRSASSSSPIVVRATDSMLVNGGKSSTNAQAKQVPSVVSDMFGTLNAHPVSSQRVNTQQPGAAPSVDTAATPAGENGPLAAIDAPSMAVLPPPAAAVSPVRVGGEIRPPHLVYSVVPRYPDIARETNVQGTVVIDTVIDKSGHVVNMKVVSGPMLLRQAALDALRQWKYEPSKLDGQPTSVQMTVSIQFRH